MDRTVLKMDTMGITICCVLILFLILYVVMIVLFLSLKKRYNRFMSGTDANSLEESIAEHLGEIKSLKEDSETVMRRLGVLERKSIRAYQKVALRKYDAFHEMGGKLSFSLCMLDENEDGFMMTSMHSTREGCYTYIKEIIKGEAFVLLSEEEKQTLDEAKAKTF